MQAKCLPPLPVPEFSKIIKHKKHGKKGKKKGILQKQTAK